MSEDPRLAAVTKASSDLGGPFSDIDHEQIAERFIAMYDALRLQQGEEVRQHQSRDRSTLAVDNATAPAAPITAGADPQPGWYVALHDGLLVNCIERIEDGWVNGAYELTTEWPYMVFTLGPRIDDLLRDAARVKQMERALGAAKDFIVLEELSPAEHVFEIHKRAEVRAKIYTLIDAEIAREREE